MKSYRILKKIPPKSIKTPQNSYTHTYTFPLWVPARYKNLYWIPFRVANWSV